MKLNGDKKSIVVKWKKNKKVSGYRVYYSTKKSMKGKELKVVKGSKKTGCKISGLKTGKKYYVQVKAIKTIKGKTFTGRYTAIKAAKAQ
ncbi:MAG: fibronectin type III domain-containing protein [Ruminococcus sp.]|nr:fibronectin type III domain-containing protein [Ruminococcus sp.]